MIRLGSLAGYPFEGPRVLAGWTAPEKAAVYAIVCRNDPEGKPNDYSVIMSAIRTISLRSDFRFDIPTPLPGQSGLVQSGTSTSVPMKFQAG